MKITKALVKCFVVLTLSNSMGFAETYQTVKVTADTLNVRESMSTDSTIVGKLNYNDVIETSNLSNGWYELNFSGALAYVSADYTALETNYRLGSITGKNVNLRDKPSTTNSTVLTTLSNVSINVFTKEGDWYLVSTSDGTKGYVAADFVSFQDSQSETTATSVTPSSNPNVSSLIAIAKSKLGSPYKYAQSGPDSFDCSGFVVYCFKQAYGINLPHSSTTLSHYGTKISKSDLQPGDLVFFATNGSSSVNHVGIYIGNGEFIQASSSSSNGYQVCISPINTGYYANEYMWAVRP